MKTVLMAGLFAVLLLLSVSANATLYTRVSCNYKFIPELGTNKYVGVYKSQYGNLFTAYFDSYCPPTINQ